MARKAGFTLIELLVVIAIIAILAAILFPVFARAKAAAQGVKCMSNVRNLAMAHKLYLTDYDDRVMPAAYATDTGVVIWHDILDPYIKNKEIWLCPTSELDPTDSNGAPTSHFGYNAYYLTGLLTDFSNVYDPWPITDSSLEDPSNTLMFADSHSSIPGSWCGNDGKYLLPPSQADADCWGRPNAVHIEGFNISWMDMHASKKKVSQIYSGQDPADKYFDLQ